MNGEGWRKCSRDNDMPTSYASSGVTVGHIATPRGTVVANITCSVPLHATNVAVLDIAIAAWTMKTESS